MQTGASGSKQAG